MSTTFSSGGVATETAGYGGLVDAVGGVATVVLAIIALAGIHQEVLAPIAVIVFGAALLIQGGAMLSDFAQAGLPVESADQFGLGGLSVSFLVGVGGIVLGVLALIGIAPMVLTPIAVIAFGAAAVLSSNSVRQLYVLRSASMRQAQAGSTFLAGEMAAGSAGVQLLAGLAAVVLGILAVTGTNPAILVLSALIVLGAAIVLSGSTLSGIVLGFMPNMEGTARARITS